MRDFPISRTASCDAWQARLNISRLLTALIFGFGLSVCHAQNWPAPPKIAASSWILLDASTGQTLAVHNAERAIAPASLTKLMTAYLTFSALRERKIRLDQTVSAPVESEVPQGSRMFLQPGKSVSVADLVAGLLTVNAHDAAIALAKTISGSESEFVALMNKTALRLGLNSTQFENATGVPQAAHRTTVADLSKLSMQLINDFPENIREFSRREFAYSNIRQVNRNRLLWLDSSVDGLMTGRSETEGFAMAVTAHRPQPLGKQDRVQRRLLVVIAGATTEESRAQEGLKLLNFGFQQFDIVRLFRSDELSETIPVYKGVLPEARIHFPRDVLVAVPRGRAGAISTRIERVNALLAPVSAGQTVGQLKIWLENTEIHQVPVVTADTVKPAGLMGRAIDAVRLWWKSI